MEDLLKVFNFSLDTNNLDTFDDLVNMTKIDQIETQISQMKFLLESDKLK
jgi:hypothetical protein